MVARTSLTMAILLALVVPPAAAQDDRTLPLTVYVAIDISHSVLSGPPNSPNAATAVARIGDVIRGLGTSLDRAGDRVVPVLFGGSAVIYAEITDRKTMRETLRSWAGDVENIHARNQCAQCGQVGYLKLMTDLQPQRTAFDQVLDKIIAHQKEAAKLDKERRRVVVLLVTDGEPSIDDSGAPQTSLDLGRHRATFAGWLAVLVIGHSGLKPGQTKTLWEDAADQARIRQRFLYKDFPASESLRPAAIDVETDALIRSLRGSHIVTIAGPEDDKLEIGDRTVLELTVRIHRDKDGGPSWLHAERVRLEPAYGGDPITIARDGIFPNVIPPRAPAESGSPQDVKVAVLLPPGSPAVGSKRSDFRGELHYRILDAKEDLIEPGMAPVQSIAFGAVRFDVGFYDNVVWQFGSIPGLTPLMNRLLGGPNRPVRTVPVEFSTDYGGPRRLYWQSKLRGVVRPIQGDKNAAGRIEPAGESAGPTLLKPHVNLLVSLKHLEESVVVGNEIEWISSPRRSFQSARGKAHVLIAVLVGWQAVMSLLSWVVSLLVAGSAVLYFLERRRHDRGAQDLPTALFGRGTRLQRLGRAWYRVTGIDGRHEAWFFGLGAVALAVGAFLHLWPLVRLQNFEVAFVNWYYVIFLSVCALFFLWARAQASQGRLVSARLVLMPAGVGMFSRFVRSLPAEVLNATLLRTFAEDRWEVGVFFVVAGVLWTSAPLIRRRWPRRD